MLLLLLLLLLHGLDHLVHQVPGLPLHLDRLCLPRVLKLQHVLNLANVRQGPPHELHRTWLLLLLPALLLASLLLLPALLLLTALCHGVSSPSDLRPRFIRPRPFQLGTFPTRSGPKLDPGGTKAGVYAPDGGGTKTKRRRRGAFSYGKLA